MPELPEVQTVLSGIQKTIANANITSIDVFCNALRYKVDKTKVPLIIGAKISQYRRIGKYIVIDLDNSFSIILHLGMSGRVTINPIESKKHDHIKISTSNGIVVYNDARRFGMFDIVKTNEINNISFFKKMGLDPFNKSLNESYLLEKFKNKKIDIKSALLDQTIIAGIGNIYASEILFKAKISPLREALSINKNESKKIILYTKEVLSLAIEKGGSTLKDYRQADGNLGYFQNMHCVYGKDGQQCSICHCIIKRIVQKGRVTYYCPKCQKGE
ncbi:MAG: bifunctional DNA-formamidopyrimidine glycosylase/DNA-(apurinic or apyrimidinic site) lyase [Alphaproteobacteria bacterium]